MGGFFGFFFLGKIGKRRKWRKMVVRRRLREAGSGGVVVGERWEVVGWCGRVVFWRMRDGGGVSGKREKRENGGFWVAGGEWVGRRKAGGGVSVVGEVVGGGG
jgi:hypothetical protein